MLALPLTTNLIYLNLVHPDLALEDPLVLQCADVNSDCQGMPEFFRRGTYDAGVEYTANIESADTLAEWGIKTEMLTEGGGLY